MIKRNYTGEGYNPWHPYADKAKVHKLAYQPPVRVRIDQSRGHKAGETYEVFDPKIHRVGAAS